MLMLDKTHVMNFDNAARGARNPMNSWDRSDSYFDDSGVYVLGKADLALLGKLSAAGSTHRKYLRQIFIAVDILGPLYWWKEFDTYKIATVANSTSTMHKIHSKPFDLNDFSHDKLNRDAEDAMKKLVTVLEKLRTDFIETKDKSLWYSMIQLLPSSYNQMRTVTMNYENVIGMYRDRTNHKLEEWKTFCEWAEALPYFAELIKPAL